MVQKYRSCISWSVFLTLPTTLTIVNKHYGMFVTELLLRVNPLKQFLRHLCAVTHRRSLRHIYIRVFSYFIDYVCHLLHLYCRRGPPCALNITLLTLGPSWMPLVSMLHFLFGVTLCGISPVRACIVGMAPSRYKHTLTSLWRPSCTGAVTSCEKSKPSL